MKDNMLKIFSIAVFIASFCNSSFAETDQNQIKFWISSQEVVVAKNWYGGSVKEKLNVSRIENLKQKKADCNGVLNLECIEKYDFTYMHKNINLSCNVTMTYTKTRIKNDHALKLIVVDCNVN